jgi:hypothetical protein
MTPGKIAELRRTLEPERSDWAHARDREDVWRALPALLAAAERDADSARAVRDLQRNLDDALAQSASLRAQLEVEHRSRGGCTACCGDGVEMLCRDCYGEIERERDALQAQLQAVTAERDEADRMYRHTAKVLGGQVAIREQERDEARAELDAAPTSAAYQTAQLAAAKARAESESLRARVAGLLDLIRRMTRYATACDTGAWIDAVQEARALLAPKKEESDDSEGI